MAKGARPTHCWRPNSRSTAGRGLARAARAAEAAAGVSGGAARARAAAAAKADAGAARAAAAVGVAGAGAWSRKPNPGMLEAGRQLIENAHRFPGEHNVLSYGEEWVDRPSESTSFLIGDRESDILAAERFGVKGILCDPDSGISGVIHRVIDLEER